jgi:hypothetical protein
MSVSKLKLAAVFGLVMSTAGCVSTNSMTNVLSDSVSIGKGVFNKATSALDNKTHNIATSITFDDATGKPSYVSQSEGVGACLRSNELRQEVKHTIANKQEASFLLAHSQFESATNTCAQYTAFNLAAKGGFDCAIVNGNVTIGRTNTEPQAASDCSADNIFARSTEIKKGAYLPGGKYNP